MTIRTHKEWDGYAENYTHDFPLSAVPRDPTAYTPTEYFTGKRKKRGITDEIISGCIEDGEVFEAEGDNRYRFLWTHSTTLQTFALIVELHREAFKFERQKHECITVYRFEH